MTSLYNEEHKKMGAEGYSSAPLYAFYAVLLFLLTQCFFRFVHGISKQIIINLFIGSDFFQTRPFLGGRQPFVAGIHTQGVDEFIGEYQQHDKANNRRTAENSGRHNVITAIPRRRNF